MRSRYVMLLVVMAALTGCVSVTPLPLADNAAPKLAGQQIVVVKRAVPDFGALTAGEAAAGGLFGPIGGAVAGQAMINAGNAIVQQHGVDDPSREIAETLTRALVARYGATSGGLGSYVITPDDDEPARVAAAYQASPFVIDVRTTNWGFLYFPTDWSHYRVNYRARMRLISTERAEVIAEGGCVSLPDKTDDAPTYDELLGNGALRLKTELKKAAELCIREYSSKYLGL